MNTPQTQAPPSSTPQWGRYLFAVAGVLGGLLAIEAAVPQAALPMAILVLLGVAIAHPQFGTELRAISKNLLGS